VSAVDDEVSPGFLDDLVARVSLTQSAAAQADAVVLLTDHDHIDFDLVQREASWILDCRNRLTGTNIERL
jgi:UDP-N-acetyl-D-glucosamine dehydrogenase